MKKWIMPIILGVVAVLLIALGIYGLVSGSIDMATSIFSFVGAALALGYGGYVTWKTLKEDRF